jgi:hypothetical protein
MEILVIFAGIAVGIALGLSVYSVGAWVIAAVRKGGK